MMLRYQMALYAHEWSRDFVYMNDFNSSKRGTALVYTARQLELYTSARWQYWRDRDHDNLLGKSLS
jgi:hypothetical protein